MGGRAKGVGGRAKGVAGGLKGWRDWESSKQNMHWYGWLRHESVAGESLPQWWETYQCNPMVMLLLIPRVYGVGHLYST